MTPRSCAAVEICWASETSRSVTPMSSCVDSRTVTASGWPELDTVTSTSHESTIRTRLMSQSRNLAPVRSATMKLAPRNAWLLPPS